MKPLHDRWLKNEIAINLHYLISKWWRWLRYFSRMWVISSNPYLSKMAKKSFADYINSQKSDGWAIRVWSLNPLVDIAIRANVIPKDIIMYYYTLFDHTSFITKLNSEIFRDPSWTAAMCDYDRYEEHIPATEFSEKSHIKYIYTDAVNILFMTWTIEKYMMNNAQEIWDILHDLQKWE